MTKKLIYLEDTLDALAEQLYHNEEDYKTAVKAIGGLPSAQPERKKGKWIKYRNDDGHNIADCNQCRNAIQWFDDDETPRYCCMCGADMRGNDNGT